MIFSHPVPQTTLLMIVTGLGICLGGTSTIAAPEPTEPLGLELWLSGEEPGIVEPEPSTGEPTIEPGMSEPGTGEPSFAAPSPLEPSLNLDTAPTIETHLGNGLEPSDHPESLESNPTAERAVPSVILSERSTGCGMTVTDQGTTLSNHCSDPESLAVALEQQWHSLHGTEHEAMLAPEDLSPLQVAVQALGSAMQSSSAIEDYYFQTQRPTPLETRNDRLMIFPLKFWAPITSHFGWRSHPLTQEWRLHTGTDLGALWGTPVVAAFSGEVQLADWAGGYGVTIVLSHPDRNQETLYAHLSEIFVQPGEWVKQGEVIGRVGSTGNSTGPHLHFELRQWEESGWVAVDAGNILMAALTGEELADTDALALMPLQPNAPSPLNSLKLTFQPRNPLEQWIGWFLQLLTPTA